MYGFLQGRGSFVVLYTNEDDPVIVGDIFGMPVRNNGSNIINQSKSTAVCCNDRKTLREKKLLPASKSLTDGQTIAFSHFCIPYDVSAMMWRRRRRHQSTTPKCSYFAVVKRQQQRRQRAIPPEEDDDQSSRHLCRHNTSSENK